MSKKLTEKFQDGSFKYGIYYCKTEEDGIKRIKKLELYHDGCDHGYAKTFGCNDDYPYEDIKEVLAPVPSYDEYKQLISKTEQLEKKLETATKALKKIERIKVGKENNFSILIAHSYSSEALKEMEGVK